MTVLYKAHSKRAYEAHRIESKKSSDTKNVSSASEALPCAARMQRRRLQHETHAAKRRHHRIYIDYRMLS